MHGTPLLPPKGDHEVYMNEDDDQGQNLSPQTKAGYVSKEPIPRTTGFVLKGRNSPEENMPEQRDKKRSIGETGEDKISPYVYKNVRLSVFRLSTVACTCITGA